MDKINDFLKKENWFLIGSTFAGLQKKYP